MKSNRIIKFKTESNQTDLQDFQDIKKKGLFLRRKSNLLSSKLLFKQRNINTAVIQQTCINKKSSNFSKAVFFYNNKTSPCLSSTRLLKTGGQKRSNKQIKQMKSFLMKNEMITIIKNQILICEKQIIQILQLLTNIQSILQKLLSEVYSYSRIEQCLKKLNHIIKDTLSRSLLYECYTLCGLSLFIYGSYSLSIFYFDKALKKLLEIEPNHITQQNRNKQIQIYKTVTQIFLIQGEYRLAKQFAYKYLRKAWYSKNLQEQFKAYDILGKVYYECEIKSMSLYFHNRMCKGEREDLEFIKLSNFQLKKCQKEQNQFAVYETIHIFIQKDKIFHEMLQDRYRMRDHNFEDKQVQSGKINFFLHTHRSPNRNSNSYRVLQRRMIQDKNSRQLHFIKPRQVPSIKKLFIEFMRIIFRVREQIEADKQKAFCSFNQIA